MLGTLVNDVLFGWINEFYGLLSPETNPVIPTIINAFLGQMTELVTNLV
jgi:hypothetical protein